MEVFLILVIFATVVSITKKVNKRPSSNIRKLRKRPEETKQ
jgi:hypothetical protein